MTETPEEKDETDASFHRASADIVTEIQSRIPGLLWSGDRVREWAPRNKFKELVRLIETFQELPQLLDPHLSKIVSPLVTAFLTHVENHAKERLQLIPNEGLIPLPQAICSILYILCKIRGYKVISRFFNNEPTTLESLLNTFDIWSKKSSDSSCDAHSATQELEWEERYVVLLWLSHLTLTPFGLSSISSPRPSTASHVSLPFSMHSGIPYVAERLLSLGLSSLSSPSKEREASRILLVRLSLRPDMQQLGLLNTLIGWALSSLQIKPKDKMIHLNLGILSYLAGVTSSADSSTIEPFLTSIFEYLHSSDSTDTNVRQLVGSSAVARKLITKLDCAVAKHVLMGLSELPEDETDQAEDMLTTTIDCLLTSLGDKDSPIRFAASKALSVIALRLSIEMTTDIVDDIVQRLEENVLWEDSRTGDTITSFDQFHVSENIQLNLTTVDPLKWQGLILTLSHLLFRRSVSPNQGQLQPIINKLVTALAFEQRSTNGRSLGTSIRDAACFGIWSLVRKYTTKELLGIDASTLHASMSIMQPTSVFHFAAIELVVTATLDPEGNIRRGASAALQELVGRHPDLVPNGIQLIQIVDYHAVALRRRAISEIAFDAAALDESYMRAIFHGLTTWRGINAPDSDSRRLAAKIIGRLTGKYHLDSVKTLSQSFESSRSRPIEEWHGLYLAVAAAIREDPTAIGFMSSFLEKLQNANTVIYLLKRNVPLSKDIHQRGYKGDIVAEAFAIMILALSSISGSSVRASLSATDLAPHTSFLQLCLKRENDITMSAAREAAVQLLYLLDSSSKTAMVRYWLFDIKEGRTGQLSSKGSSLGTISAVGALLQQQSALELTLDGSEVEQIREILLSFAAPDVHIPAKIEAIRSLLKWAYIDCSSSELSKEKVHIFLVDSCLSDYTTDHRGDIGSLVRIEAIKTLHTFPSSKQWPKDKIRGKLFGLAVEKLDKVRQYAWECLQERSELFELKPLSNLPTLTPSTTLYFAYLLSHTHPLANSSSFHISLLEGYVTSAASGTESVINASRTALLAHMEILDEKEKGLFFGALVEILKREVPDGRLSIASLEVLGFLIDAVEVGMGLFDGMKEDLFTALNRYSRTSDLRRVEAVVRVCAALAGIESCKKTAIGRLKRMLLHRFTKIRWAAATELVILEPGNEKVKGVDWGVPVAELRGVDVSV